MQNSECTTIVSARESAMVQDNYGNWIAVPVGTQAQLVEMRGEGGGEPTETYEVRVLAYGSATYSREMMREKMRTEWIPAISVSLQDADSEGRVLLPPGTEEVLARLGLCIYTNPYRDSPLRVLVHDDAHEAEAEVELMDNNHIWVARIDRSTVRDIIHYA